MQTTEEDEERAQSGERSRGKRRTAREIATMFEQLKRRHIARKKEWQDEREELMTRVQTADESQRVLSEIKLILHNLREELRLEERTRIGMEKEHLAEKRRWGKERAELLKRIEESACESDRDGKDMTRMTEKLNAQSRRLSEFQTTTLDLKKQLLEKENSFLRDKRQLQFGFEKERSLWKKKEQTLTDKLSQLDTKSSASSTSPSHVGVENVRDFINAEDYVGVRRKSSPSSATEQSTYNNFQRTVDDALKQIEQISSELNDIDVEKHKLDRTSATPSPRLQFHTTTTPPEQPPSPNAPWRTKRRSSASKHVTSGKSLSPDSKYNISSSSVLSESPADVSIYMPSINTAHAQMKRSPNPERKVRKINTQGNKCDIIVSSPDAPTPTGTSSGRFFPFADQSISESNISRDFISDTSANSKGLEANSKKATQTNVPRRERSPKLSRQRNLDFLEDSPASKQPVHEKWERNGPRHVENKLVAKEDVDPKQLGTSSRLPKLHQQLLFKKEPLLPRDKILAQKSFESESLASTDKGKTSDDDSGLLFTNTRDISKAYPKERNSKQTYTPSVGAKLASTEQYEKRRRNGFSANTYQLNDAPNTISQSSIDMKRDEVPPVVHPKPKVSIHKDQEGNIVRVSPAADRKSTSPESLQGNEKQCSIAERMGKAGRDWIRKKLSFKDRRPEDQHGGERSQGTPDQTKHRGKSKTRHRPSSLLRSKSGQRSLSSSEESSDAEQEERRRESFLRRTRKKGKGSEGYNSASPVRKPKKYTRSKTEASSRDMRNFLNKFKASQSNPNKPSVVKQFELKLLENEVKTLNEDNIGAPHAWKSQQQNDASVSSGQQQLPRDGECYLSGEEGDAELDPMSPIYGDSARFLPTMMDPEVTFQEKAKAAPKVKPKSYYRRSMTDFKPNAESQERVSESDNRFKGRGRRIAPEGKSNSTLEAGELCERKGVSKLVNRFSANLDDDVVLGVKKPIQNRPVRKSSFVSTIESEKSDTRNRENPRSHSPSSSHQGQRHRKRLSANVRFDTDPINEGLKIEKPKEDTENWDSHVSWSDRVTAKPAPETRNHKSSLSTSSGPSVTQPHRVSAPPQKFDSLSSFWESERPPPEKEQDKIPGRMKRLSEKMQRKADMLENALTKGPRKPRRYRRADTQPVLSGLHSTESDTLSDTDDVLDVALPPFTKDLVKTNGENAADFQEPRRMHRTIPPVTGKFSKPAKPGRLPSRWAR